MITEIFNVGETVANGVMNYSKQQAKRNAATR